MPTDKTDTTKPAHTPEPWQATAYDEEIKAGEEMFGLVSYGGYPPLQANTARIVAAVNACAGMDDPAAVLAEVRTFLNDVATGQGYDWTDAERLLARLGSGS